MCDPLHSCMKTVKLCFGVSVIYFPRVSCQNRGQCVWLKRCCAPPINKRFRAAVLTFLPLKWKRKPSQLNYVTLRKSFTIRDEWMTQFDAISQIPFHVLLKKRKTLQKWSIAQHSVKMSIPCAAWVKDCELDRDMNTWLEACRLPLET